MGNCCGPFKRGRPAKAINPDQQCFADCCGNICPPETCCDSIVVQYECGCGCECSQKGFNFSGLRFKKKKKSKSRIPTFSKGTLVANGFTFSNGTIPSSSSSSSEEWICVQELYKTGQDEGCCCPNSCLDSSSEPNAAIGAYWSQAGLGNCAGEGPIGGGTSYCGDEACNEVECAAGFYRAPIGCLAYYDNEGKLSRRTGWLCCPEGSDTSSDTCQKCQKCILKSEFDPAKHVQVGGPYTTKEECQTKCCGPCICYQTDIKLTTEGCCLYLGPSGVEAVGGGKVTASVPDPQVSGCNMTVLLNGSVASTEVSDGELIQVEMQTEGNCKCCEVGRDCKLPSASLWVQKNKADRKTIVMDRDAMRAKVKMAVDRVRKRKRS